MKIDGYDGIPVGNAEEVRAANIAAVVREMKSTAGSSVIHDLGRGDGFGYVGTEELAQVVYDKLNGAKALESHFAGGEGIVLWKLEDRFGTEWGTHRFGRTPHAGNVMLWSGFYTRDQQEALDDYAEMKATSKRRSTI